MPEIVVSSEDLTVFGGPATVNVEVDFGPAGSRGSYIYNIAGSPNEYPNLLPSGFGCVGELLGVGVEVHEGAWFGKQVVLGLLVQLGQLVHVLAAAVVLLRLRVGDGFVQPLAQGLGVGAGHADHAVVLLEVVHLLDGLELGLQRVFQGQRQAADVVVD